MKILFVGYSFEENNTGGSKVSKNNLEHLYAIFGEENIDEFNINNSSSFFSKIFNLLKLNSSGVNKKVKLKLMNKIKKNDYKFIYFDGSLFGNLIKMIKNKFSDITIFTFFHNIDLIYLTEKIKVDGLKNLILLPSVYYNEKLSVKYSDELIVLNERDNKKLIKIYNEKDTKIIPLTLKDEFSSNKTSSINDQTITYLFVGSLFYANVEGITWFVENVMPHVPGQLLIVGKNMEKKRNELTRENVKVVGTVDDISEYYNKANFVVIPIFSGSGMKTKTTEALMYGKTIFGTTEAFEGFNFETYNIGEMCNKKDEFIINIHKYIKNNRTEKFNKDSRNLFLEKYSFNTSLEKYKEIFSAYLESDIK